MAAVDARVIDVARKLRPQLGDGDHPTRTPAQGGHEPLGLGPEQDRHGVDNRKMPADVDSMTRSNHNAPAMMRHLVGDLPDQGSQLGAGRDRDRQTGPEQRLCRHRPNARGEDAFAQRVGHLTPIGRVSPRYRRSWLRPTRW